MKKEFKNFIILVLSLIIISSIIILSFGRVYNVVFTTNNDNYKLSIDNSDGDIEVLSKKRVNNEYIVKVKAKKKGKVFLYLEKDDYKEGKMLYIHKSMIITDNNYFGKSTFSEVIPISFSIILFYILYLLIIKYKKSINYNLYQYKNIAYIGIIIFIFIFSLSIMLSIFSYQGLFDTINKIIDSMSFVSFIMFPLALITSLLVTISNIKLIIKEGRSFKNLLGLFLGLFLCLSTFIPDFVYKLLLKSQKVNIYNLNSIGPYLYNFVESLVYLTISYIECILLGTIIIAIKSVKRKIEYNKDYIIILGCQIRKDGSLSPLLKGRVDKALEFRNEQLKSTKKDLIFIPSGGKGEDELISEGEAIKNYLIEKGIDESKIIVENKSKNTYENISFSNKLIKNKNAKIAFSTTNYHVLRAGLLATHQGLLIDGIGSKTKAYFWINAFIREFIGTLYSEKKRHIIVFGLITISIIIMISITYLANNI